MSTSRLVLLLCITAVVLVPVCHGHARVFTRCQLSKELLRYNFPRSLIPKWVCILEHSSGRTTDKITTHTSGYSSYGLFQLNNKEFCKKGRKGGICTMKCEDLVNEDLADDVRCAKRIFERTGFRAWSNHFAHCKNNSLPDLSRC